ncbi:hypothetical protein [Ornithinimicrobium humiphilum]|uniref:hypothetical protein n=1 Tax=Ornithinimicrobium humiphilum TaxID=125288 RepID=UPI00147847BD|nr:hypothetical protein [Ornithinimicrobium humiphilum]
MTFTSDGTWVDWTSTVGIDAVIVKGGPNANVYRYDPPAESFGDTGLVTPTNPNNYKPYGLSHVDFCYDIELQVSKTADTSWTRSHTWTIDKVGDETELELAAGEMHDVAYDVTLDATPTDSDWAVQGEIAVTNPHDTMAATVTGVTDSMTGGIAADVDCGGDFPRSIAPGATLVCTYGPTALPDATDRVKTAVVTATEAVPGGTATADVTFSEDPTSVVDECIDVTDSLEGDLGTVCVEDLPKTISYTHQITAEECGEWTVHNVASFETNDTGATGEDDHDVAVTVECQTGCTLTQGYWKTHSEKGPAPYDETWAMLPNGADTTFFLSGKSWHEVFNTPPAGNSYLLAGPPVRRGRAERAQRRRHHGGLRRDGCGEDLPGDLHAGAGLRREEDPGCRGHRSGGRPRLLQQRSDRPGPLRRVT